MQTITGVFDTFEHASAAVKALKEGGVDQADISFVSKNAPNYDPEDVGTGATAGAGVGASLGAAGGLLAGLGIIAIPGMGPVVAGGWLFATAVGALAGAGVGAATGSLVGALTRAGITRADARVLAETVRRGGAVVTARVDEDHAAAATAILRHAEGMNIEERRKALEEEGWTGDEPEQREPDPDLPPGPARRDIVPPIA